MHEIENAIDGWWKKGGKIHQMGYKVCFVGNFLHEESSNEWRRLIRKKN